MMDSVSANWAVSAMKVDFPEPVGPRSKRQMCLSGSWTGSGDGDGLVATGLLLLLLLLLLLKLKDRAIACHRRGWRLVAEP